MVFYHVFVSVAVTGTLTSSFGHFSPLVSANIHILFFVFLSTLHQTIVSELELFPVKKSQKLAAGEGLLSSWGICLTQMLLSVEALKLEQLPPPLRAKLSAEPSVALRSGPSRS